MADLNADRDDIAYVTGHCFRAVSCLNQVLFAINEQYCINEKKAVAMADRFASKPENYKKQVDDLFGLLAAYEDRARQAVDMLKGLVAETEQLAGLSRTAASESG